MVILNSVMFAIFPLYDNFIFAAGLSACCIIDLQLELSDVAAIGEEQVNQSANCKLF